MRKFLLIPLFLFLFYSQAISATTYYVRPGGLDSHTGLANDDATAWLTIGKCASTIVAGDTCRVQAGTYNESITGITNAGSAGNLITFIADGAVTMKTLTVNKNYVVWNGFTLQGDAILTVSGNYVQILNNHITSTGGDSTLVTISGNYCTFQYNHLTMPIPASDSVDHVMLRTTSASSFALIDSNEFGPAYDADCLHPYGHDHTISNNYFHDFVIHTENPALAAHMDIFQLEGFSSSYNIYFYKNFAKNSRSQPWNVSKDNTSNVHDIYVRNNVFVNFYGTGNMGVSGFYVENNTFVCVGWATGGTESAINPIYDPTDWDCTGDVIRNNIFVQKGNYPGVNGASARCTVQYNYSSRYNGGAYTAITGWSETGGVYGGNPQFVSFDGVCNLTTPSNWPPAGGTGGTSLSNDFHIGTTSVAKDKGTTISGWTSPTDKDGISRPQGSAWDIGAYEYGAGVPSSVQGLTIQGGILK